MMAWGAVGLVVVIVAVLVIVKVATEHRPATAYTPVTPAPASVVHDVTNIPLSVYNKVGVNFADRAGESRRPCQGPAAPHFRGQVAGLALLRGRVLPLLRGRALGHRRRARPGSGPGPASRSPPRPTPTSIRRPTPSASRSHVHQPVSDVQAVEAVSNVPVRSGGYNSLETPTKEEQADVTNVRSPKYVPGPLAGQIGFPFVNISNVALISGPSYDPGILAGLSWTDIAGGLDRPTNPVTQAIVGTANYITAGICASTKEQPAGLHEPGGQGRRQGPEAELTRPDEHDRAHAAMATDHHPFS